MGFVIFASQPLDAVVRVDLRGCKGGVTEEFLYGIEVSSAFQQLRGQRVAKDVRGFLSRDFAAELLLYSPVAKDRIKTASGRSSQKGSG